MQSHSLPESKAQIEDDVYKKKAAKAPTPAMKPAALLSEAAPVKYSVGWGLTG
jgi:hypothetical protein